MKRILLVDDDQQVREVLGLVLRKNGYHVNEADSGVAGLEMARKHLPDLILSDIDMPGGDGATLLRDIRRDPELKSRQFVLMSARPDLVTPRKRIEEGADGFLSKPVIVQVLLSCLKMRFRCASIGSGSYAPRQERSGVAHYLAGPGNTFERNHATLCDSLCDSI
jgi:CheY-like chemotaxis protein